MWVDRLIGRKCSGRVWLDTTRRSETQPERAAAVGRLVGRRGVGRSGRRGAPMGGDARGRMASRARARGCVCVCVCACVCMHCVAGQVTGATSNVYGNTAV